MKERKIDSITVSYIVISVFAIIFFIAIYGVKVLDFQNVDWLYGHYEVKEDCFYGKDLTQHYMGWLCYRQSDWTFPIGNMNLFSYPYQTSVIYTDSIPLFALFFKVLSPILPEKFQYFGLWAVLCFVLQGIMAVRLFKSYTNNSVKLILAAAFFVIVPMLLWRTFIHSALCAHWNVLMAMEPLVAKTRWDRRKLLVHYSLVGFFASMTAIYLLLFCGIVLVGACLRDILETKKVVNSVLSLVFFVGVAAAAIAVMGGFSKGFESSLGGLGIYNMNLNAMFDSYGFSLMLPELPRYVTELGDKQFEGYGYLGLGFIVLLMIAVVIVICSANKYKDLVRRKVASIIALVTVIIISLVYAVSPAITFNSKEVAEYVVPSLVKDLWSIFRATGRGVWIVVYILMFVCCSIIIKFNRKILSGMIMAICLLLQFVDNLPLYNTINSYFSNDIKTCFNYEAITNYPDFWEEIASNSKIKNVILANTTTPYDDEQVSRIYNVYDSVVGPDDEYFQMYQYLLGDFSINNGKTFNYFRFSRHPYERSRQYVLDKLKKPTEEDLFIFTDYNKFQGVVTSLNMYCADGLYVGYIGELNEKYKMPEEYRDLFYIFGESEELECEDYIYSLNEGEELKCFTMELPKGKYRVSVYATNVQQLDYSLSTASGEYAEIINTEIEEDLANYYVEINNETYRAYNYLKNSGKEPIGLFAIVVSYVGQ